MKKITLVLLILMFITSSTVFAQEQTENQLQEKRIIDSVRFDEKIGLYEVKSGDETFYLSKDMKHIFIGVIVDAEEMFKKQALLSSASKKLTDEYIEKAVKIGNGKKMVIEFTDPDCPFCRKSHNFFEGKDVTRYVFFYPLTKIHPNAEKKIVHILCSENKEKAYKEVYNGKYDKDLTGLKKCDEGANILKQHKQIASKYGVKVTPYFIIDQIPVAGANLQLISELLREEK